MQCIETTTGRTSDGYGSSSITVGPKASYWMSAHVVAFEQAFGATVPKGMVVRHICDNPPCVNPLHLQMGTQSDNMQDMIARDRRGWYPNQYGLATHCINGHEFTPENTWVSAIKQLRKCRTCARERNRRYRKGA